MVREQCCKDNMRDSVILIVYNLFIVWSYPFSFFDSGHINHISWQQFAITAVSKTQKTRFISDNRWGLFSTIWKNVVSYLCRLYINVYIYICIFSVGKHMPDFNNLFVRSQTAYTYISLTLFLYFWSLHLQTWLRSLHHLEAAKRLIASFICE